MTTVKRIVTTVAGILLIASIVCAQEQSAASGRSSIAVTAAANSERVRFTAPSSVVQMRLEVYNANGEKAFDNEIRGGNVLDWHVQDGQGQRLPDGSYLCLVTSKSLSGLINQKTGMISIQEGIARVEPVDSTMLSAQQAQAVGPLEENAALTVVKEGESLTTTVIAHDGTDGQITRGRGALSFRIGDFFSGKDVEQMRLTPEGNLGIGITNPSVRLEVDGLIRSSQGILFPDGSIQYSASRKTYGPESLRPGESQKKRGGEEDQRTASPDIGGTGTTGQIAKWSDGPNGLLSDSNITEVSGAIGINGAPSTSFRLDVNGSTRIRGSNPGFNLQGLSAGGNIWLFQTVDDNGRFRLFGQDNVNPGVERLTISLSTGNVGIGATTPGAKLDVAGDINTSTQYNIGGTRVLSTPASVNTFAGISAGQVNTGANNSFFGAEAGSSNTSGAANSFFGRSAGQSNVTSSENAFFGWEAGHANTAPQNAFFGASAGRANTTGLSNAFFGFESGYFNEVGQLNSFFGASTGFQSTGSFNSFFGANAGSVAGANNIAGSSNTLIGDETGVLSTNLTNATAIGAKAAVGQNNSLVLGSIAGINGATAHTKVGIGTPFPNERLTVQTATSNFGFVHTDGLITVGSYVGGSTGGGWYGTKTNHPLSFFVNNGAPSMTMATDGNVSITHLTAANTSLCTNTSKQIINCASSLRYKTDVQRFLGGLDIVRRLRPISFTWKEGGARDLGLGAEEVDRVAPILTFRNDKGEVEGVRYNQLSAVFINVFKEQQAEIQQQREQIKRQQDELGALRRVVCRSHSSANVCKK